MLRYCIVSFLFFFIISGCETDPNIMNDDVEETFFIWGYSDLTNNHHQVRVRRAILEEGNLEDLSKDSENLIPKDPIEVYIVLTSETTREDSFLMHPTIYPKDDGMFSTEENIIYERDYIVPPGYKIWVSIKNLTTNEIVRSEAVTTEIYPFSYPQLHPWYNQEFNFTNVDEPFQVQFYTIGSSVYKLVTEIKYLDILNNGDTLFQKATFEGQPIYVDHTKPSPTGKSFDLTYLFNIFNRTIPDNPALKYRMFYRFNFKVWSGSEILKNYLQYGERFEDNRKFQFTNMIGGYGLFYACKTVNTGNITPRPSFSELLFTDPRVKDLKFSRYIFTGTYHDPDSVNSLIY